MDLPTTPPNGNPSRRRPEVASPVGHGGAFPCAGQWGVAVALLVATASAPAEFREWKNTDGRTMRAELISVDGRSARFRMESGGEAVVSITQFSGQDQVVLRGWRPEFRHREFRPSGVRWPAAVHLHPRATDVTVVPDGEGREDFVYRSRNFEFTSTAELAGSVMKEVSRTFEATYQLLQELPWSVRARRVGEYFPAELYETVHQYFAAGGPTNSGGVYKIREHKFLVPFRSLGLRQKNGRYFKTDHFDNETLVHEVTHMMMDEQLPFLPIWVIEGAAEYTGAIPFVNGRFQCDDIGDGVRGYLKRYVRGRLSFDDLKGVVDISTTEWHERSKVSNEQHRLYRSSFLLLYYFLHLDGTGERDGMLRLFHHAGEEGRRWREYEDSYRCYISAIEEFSRLPGVEEQKDGTLVYPDSLAPPQEPPPPSEGGYSELLRFKEIDLIKRGRTEDEILADVRRTFAEHLKIEFR